MDTSLLIVIIITVVVVSIVVAGVARQSRQKTELNREYYKSEWQTIQTLKNEGGSSWNLAVLEADNLLCHALKHCDYRGDTMAMRLKAAASKLSQAQAIWDAHALRNKLAHENGIKLDRAKVQKCLQAYRSGLKDLGAL